MDIDGLVERIVAASEDGGAPAVREELDRLISDPEALKEALPEPRVPVLEPIYISDGLTIMNVVWGPRMYLGPHDHRMWACIGIYGGREDNQLYRREGESIASAGGRSLHAGESISLGDKAVHSVHNPLGRLTGAVHVYGGAFLTEPRSEWDPETMTERTYSSEKARRAFEESARAMTLGA